MATDNGQPPRGGFAGLVPELLVVDIEASLRFWIDGLGFTIAYQRTESKFAYLERPEGAQIMLCQRWGKWETGPMEMPFGRGAMFQIHVEATEPVQKALEALGIPLHEGPREVWRQWGDREGGNREIFVLDPNGYLIMMTEELGERPLSPKDEV
ncbi:VOC family protein [Rhizobium sp. C4]|uniref:VOC family protein n=1 Tax=Rhizobium sp. C4 TaxID=1349800 RepID=UPI001E4E884A|nr:VOC family protein [Rhizobium sp. C4]MCD2174770.1 VOC family protein [Rhizobium sp. C4]